MNNIQQWGWVGASIVQGINNACSIKGNSSVLDRKGEILQCNHSSGGPKALHTSRKAKFKSQLCKQGLMLSKPGTFH